MQMQPGSLRPGSVRRLLTSGSGRFQVCARPHRPSRRFSRTPCQIRTPVLPGKTISHQNAKDWIYKLWQSFPRFCQILQLHYKGRRPQTWLSQPQGTPGSQLQVPTSLIKNQVYCSKSPALSPGLSYKPDMRIPAKGLDPLLPGTPP